MSVADAIIARRSTADGKHVCLWSDGSLTWALGSVIKGSANPRTPVQIAEALRAGWLVLGDVELYDADEVAPLIAAARTVAKKGGDPGDMRSRFAESMKPRAQGSWTVQSTDAYGNPTERVWRFPRLSAMSDLAIWHERGKYEVCRRFVGSRETYAPTGFIATTFAEAYAFAELAAGRSEAV